MPWGLGCTRSADSCPRRWGAALGILKTSLRAAFQQKTALQREAVELTRWLSRFQHSDHVSVYGPTKDGPRERLWFGGHIHLECTVNGNLSGSLAVGNPGGEPMHIRVFGRPLKYHDGKVWQLNWRSSDLREEIGTTNLFVSKADLESGEALVGQWVGRSSWTDDDVRATGGPVILHSRPDLTARELRSLVMKHKDAAIPDLRLLADRVVPFGRVKIARQPDPSLMPETRAVTAPSPKSPRPR